MEALKYRGFFTFCFVPLIPTTSLRGRLIVKCSICGYEQDTSIDQLENVRRNEGHKNQNGPGPIQGYYI